MLIKKENQILIHFDQSQLKSSVSEYRFQQPRLVVFYLEISVKENIKKSKSDIFHNYLLFLQIYQKNSHFLKTILNTFL